MKIKETKLLTPHFFELKDNSGLIIVYEKLDIKNKHYIKLEQGDKQATEIAIITEIYSATRQNFTYSFQLTGKKYDIELELPFQDVDVMKDKNYQDMDDMDVMAKVRRNLAQKNIETNTTPINKIDSSIENEPQVELYNENEVEDLVIDEVKVEEIEITIDHKDLLQQKLKAKQGGESK